MAVIGSLAESFNGGRVDHSNGYVLVYSPGHPRAARKFVYEHILVAEKVLGHALPLKAVVHHVKQGRDARAENDRGSLVICQDQSYHMLLHRRLKAFLACGNPTFVRCRYCKEYGPPTEVRIEERKGGYHRSCKNVHVKEKRAAKRAERIAEPAARMRSDHAVRAATARWERVLA